MTHLFIDASALVAILAPEADHATYSIQVMAAGAVLWSPMVLWETVAALRHAYGASVTGALERVMAFANENGFELVAIGEREAEAAIDAYARYGKGLNTAKLNMGDCFAYACAKTNNAKLLYKGDDFSKTDMA